MRRTIAVLVVVGLAIAVVLLLINRDDGTTPDTLAGGTTTTISAPASTTIPASTTSTTMGGTTTNPTEIRVVETVEEAEAILRELWFGWFEGIYNEDEERIREVVVLDETVEQAKTSFGTMTFSTRPDPTGILLTETEILRSNSDCIAVWTRIDVSAFRSGATDSSGVNILRRVTDGWQLLSVWPNRGDLWEADCESTL